MNPPGTDCSEQSHGPLPPDLRDIIRLPDGSCIQEALSFSGLRCLVTGASRGIGKAISLGLLSAGASVIGTFREDRDREEWWSREDVLHLPLSMFQGDFLDPESTTEICERVKDERVDVLVNNAAMNRIRPVMETTDQDWTVVRRVNLDAPLTFTRAIGASMADRGFGRIVNIGSIFGHVSKRQRALYSTTKFGLRGLTVASALDLAEAGVLVNCVAPGFVETDLTKQVLGREGMAEMEGKVPIGRLARPSEIVPIVLFLASRANTFITGQTVIVDGGFTCE